MKYANLGSISHGTLRNGDLLGSFGYELQWQIQRNGDHFSKPEHFNECRTLNNLVHDAFEMSVKLEEEEDSASLEESASELVDNITDVLSQFAPLYSYFGSADGDGADFGFWPDMGSIEDLPKYEDLADVPEDNDEDFAIVNDHGNVTVYGADGKEIFGIV